MRKSNGPRTEPWGTPNNILFLPEISEPIWVVWVLSDRYEENQSLITPRIPEWCNLHNKMLWSTVSKAFFRLGFQFTKHLPFKPCVSPCLFFFLVFARKRYWLASLQNTDWDSCLVIMANLAKLFNPKRKHLPFFIPFPSSDRPRVWRLKPKQKTKTKANIVLLFRI